MSKKLEDLVKGAEKAFKSGDFEKATKLAEKAGKMGAAQKAVGSLAELKAETKPLQVKTAEIQRLDMSGGSANPQPVITPDDVAMKSWYVSKYGQTAQGAEQIANEIYGRDFVKLSWAKHADMRRWMKTGYCERDLERVLLYSPQQIVNAAAFGVSVAEMKATMIEGQDTLGGYLVPEDVRMDLIARLPGLTVVRALASVDQTTRDRISYPKLTGGNSFRPGNMVSTWVDESPTGTEAATNETWGSVAIPIHVNMGHTQITRSLLEDSGFDVMGRFNVDLSLAWALDEDNQFLTGNGIGRPQGVLTNNTSGGLFDSDGTTVTSGVTGAATSDTIIQCVYKLDAQYRNSASCAWAMNKTTLLNVRQLKNGGGDYIWDNKMMQMASFAGGGQNNGGPSAPAQAGTIASGALVGYPIRESEQMPAFATTNHVAIFADWSGYKVVDRVGMSVLRYDDSTTAKANAVVFVGRRRLGGQPTDGWKFVSYKLT